MLFFRNHKMTRGNFLFSIIILFQTEPTSSVLNDQCSYSFNVWHPDENIQQKVNFLELKFDNASANMERRFLEIKQEIYFQLSQLQYQRRRRKKAKVTERDLSQFSIFQGELNEMIKRLNTLSGEYVSLRNRIHLESGRTTTIAPTTPILPLVTSNQPVAMMQHPLGNNLPSTSFKRLESIINDLKTEWIMMKRDIIHLMSENSAIKSAQNLIRSTTDHLNRTVHDLQKVSPVNNAENRVLNSINSERSGPQSLYAAVQSKLDTLTSVIQNFKSDVEHLKNDNAHLKRTLLVQRSSQSSRNQEAHPSENEYTQNSFLGTPSDCHDVYAKGHRSSGVYQIQPRGKPHQDDVYCQFVNDTAYTVFQRRVDGLLDFNRRWVEYKHGFGNPYAEFWLGNEFLHLLTTQHTYILRVDIWDWEGNQAYAEFDNFRLSGNDTDYTLSVGDYHGTAGNSLSYHNNMKFSTEDVDNDLTMHNCASESKSGWWFNTCLTSNLNGIFRVGWYTREESSFADGIVWYTLKNSENYSLRKTEMKLKRMS